MIRSSTSTLEVAANLPRNLPATSRHIPVLYIISSLQRGGAEKQLFLLLRSLDRNLYSPSVVALVDGEWRREIESLHIPLTVIGKGSRLTQLYRIAQHLQSHNPTILHCIGTSAGLRGRLAALFCRVPIILMSERSSPERQSLLTAWRERLLSQMTSKLITNSSHAATYLAANGICRAEQVVVIKNGIDLQDLPRSYIPATFSSSEAVHIGYLANFIPLKNHTLLVETARILLAKFPNLRFHFAGSGVTMHQVQSLIQRHALTDYFYFHGAIARTADFLSKLHLYVHASTIEGTPNAIMEAMALGIPVIAAPSQGAVELLDHGQYGLLAKDFQPSSLALQVEAALQNSVDLRALVARARRLLELEYSTSRMVQDTINLYTSELAKHAHLSCR